MLHYRVDGTAAYAPQIAAPLGNGAAVSAAVRRNRKKALSMDRAFVFFIALMSAAAVFMCVQYLQLKRDIKAQARANEALESRLIALRGENDALEESVNNSIDWNYVREAAVERLGMKYATEEQIVWYNTSDSYFVRQYCDVPS